MMQEIPEHQRQSDRQRQSTATEIALIRRDITSMNDKLDAILRELPGLNQRINAVESRETVCAARVDDMPGRVRVLEEWKAQATNVPEDVRKLKEWQQQAIGALGLTRWAFAGGVLGIISLIVMLATLINNGLKP